MCSACDGSPLDSFSCGNCSHVKGVLTLIFTVCCGDVCRLDLQEGELPQLLRQHNEEVRVLKRKLKKSREAAEGHMEQYDMLVLEVHKRNDRNKKLGNEQEEEFGGEGQADSRVEQCKESIGGEGEKNCDKHKGEHH